jgi:hypothetical protein
MVCHVYIWYDKYRPFYVGIGGDNRLKSPKRNKQATSRRKRAETLGTFKQEVVLSGSRKNCSEVEKLLIYTYGSVSKGGLLFNFTAGGDGGVDKNLLPPGSLQKIIEGGVKGAAKAKELGVGIWGPGMDLIRVENGKKSGKLAVDTGQLEKARSLIDHVSMAEEMKSRGTILGLSNRDKVSITDGICTKMIPQTELLPKGWRFGDAGGKSKGATKSALTPWEDPDHPELGTHNAGNLVRKQKSLALPHSKENRRKVYDNP